MMIVFDGQGTQYDGLPHHGVPRGAAARTERYFTAKRMTACGASFVISDAATSSQYTFVGPTVRRRSAAWRRRAPHSGLRGVARRVSPPNDLALTMAGDYWRSA